MGSLTLRTPDICLSQYTEAASSVLADCTKPSACDPPSEDRSDSYPPGFFQNRVPSRILDYTTWCVYLMKYELRVRWAMPCHRHPIHLLKNNQSRKIKALGNVKIGYMPRINKRFGDETADILLTWNQCSGKDRAIYHWSKKMRLSREGRGCQARGSRPAPRRPLGWEITQEWWQLGTPVSERMGPPGWSS